MTGPGIHEVPGPVTAEVSGEAVLSEEADAAKANCPLSRALAGVPDVTLQATLADA